jgi:putative membrane protein
MSMPVTGGEVRLERLARYLFNAPSWPVSLAILCILGLILDMVTLRIGSTPFLGTIFFSVPALCAFLLTKPLVSLLGRPMTWNRSALLALSCAVFGMLIVLCGLIVSPLHIGLSCAIALGFILGLRLLVLVAIADYRITRMIIPSATQSLTGILVGALVMEPVFLPLSILLQVLFCAGFTVLIWLIDRPLYRAFHVRGLDFINSFLAHLTDGSKALEEYFEKIGEEVTVPEVSIFFSRKDRRGLLITIPNVHPGPVGEIGGGNIPKGMQAGFDEMVMVPHGAATHDFNPVSEKEIGKLVEAVVKTRGALRYSPLASRSVRFSEGSVSLLCQVFDSTLLIVSTRSPERTEDIDFNVGMTIMGEGHRFFENVGFIDAHNCSAGDVSYVLPATRLAMEYYWAGMKAIGEMPGKPREPMELGISQVRIPFTREQGFGDNGIQIALVRTAGQTTAYVLFDGNNMEAGVRDEIRNFLLRHVDEAEVMTTDSHVVNTVRGRNPVGLHVPVKDIIPWVEKALSEALADLAPAEAAGSTAWCEGIKIFGSHRITQMASTVNTMLIFIPFISAGMLLLVFILSVIAYILIG